MTSVIIRVLFVAVFSAAALISNAQAQTTVVVSSNPLWTPTGITLSSGDTVTITASGSWSRDGVNFSGPDGLPSGPLAFDEFQNFDANDHGRLIGFIGPDPYQGHQRTGSGFFPQPTGYISVGSSTTFTASTSGPLWLGFNDDAQSAFTFDNVGSVTAVVSVGSSTVCNPPARIVPINDFADG